MTDIKPYLEAKKGERNTFEQLPIEESGLYCGRDSLFCTRLAKKQKRLIRAEGLQDAYDLFHEGSLSFARMELEGVRVDVERAKRWKTRWEDRLGVLKEKILTSPEAKRFEKAKGRQLKYEKKLSGKDLQYVLFDILKIKPLTGTERKTGWAVDEEAINHYAEDCELLRWELKVRKQEVQNKYLNLILKAEYDGFIYPSFDLHITQSYRSSSSNPPFQNFPRHEDDLAVVRKLIIPREGNEIWTVDYGGHELRMIACTTHDEALIEYIEQGHDLHADMMLEIFGVLGITRKTAKTVFGPLRSASKNSKVFPLCYGSYYKSTAKNLWDHPAVKATGVLDGWYPDLSPKRRYAKWEQHIRDVEDWFWKKFRGIRRWQDNYIKGYQGKGYAKDLAWGFKRRGYLTRNKLYNFPHQGPGFHCLMWDINRIMEWVDDYTSKLCAEIHDDLFWDGKPSEFGDVQARVDRIMLDDIREAHPWIIVPLETEWKKSAKSWYHIKDI